MKRIAKPNQVVWCVTVLWGIAAVGFGTAGCNSDGNGSKNDDGDTLTESDQTGDSETGTGSADDTGDTNTGGDSDSETETGTEDGVPAATCDGFAMRLYECGIVTTGDLSCALSEKYSPSQLACVLAAECSALTAFYCAVNAELAEDAFFSACLFTCGDGNEIEAAYECDGEADCADGSDEHDACALFTCTSGEKIPARYECDFTPDCTDGSDEPANCPVFPCASGDAEAAAGWECDLYSDCTDGSDEHDACAKWACE